MCIVLLQDYSGAALDEKIAQKEVDTEALAATMPVVAAEQKYSWQDMAWVAGPVIGSVVGATILVGVWYMLKRKPCVAGNPVPVDAAGQLPAAASSAAKYAAGSAASQASDGGPPRSEAKVCTCLHVNCLHSNKRDAAAGFHGVS